MCSLLNAEMTNGQFHAGDVFKESRLSGNSLMMNQRKLVRRSIFGNGRLGESPLWDCWIRLEDGSEYHNAIVSENYLQDYCERIL